MDSLTLIIFICFDGSVVRKRPLSCGVRPLVDTINVVVDSWGRTTGSIAMGHNELGKILQIREVIFASAGASAGWPQQQFELDTDLESSVHGKRGVCEN